MKDAIFRCLALFVALFALMGAGCKPGVSKPDRTPADNSQPAPPPAPAVFDPANPPASAGYTAFAISEGTVGAGSADALYSFTIQLVGQGCDIWTDAGPWKYGELSPRTASASYVLPGNHQLSWKCQTPDERAFTSIEICGRDYLLADGFLFLISPRAGAPQVVQLKLREYNVHELKPLAAQFPEVAQFLARKPFTPTVPNGEAPRSVAPR